MAYFGENWDENEFPAAYLITIRTFGTWLHGDERSSIDRKSQYNVRGAPKRGSNPNLHKLMSENMKGPAVEFNRSQRKIVHEAIKEVCKNRGYLLYALNVRANHAHSVVAGQVKPERIADAFKAYSTRKLREHGLIQDERIWSRGRSRRYLWKMPHVDAAIDYVLYCQSDNIVFDTWYGERFDD